MTDKLSNHYALADVTPRKHEEVAVSTIPYYPVPGSPEQMTGLPVPVQIAVAPPARQRRVTVFFRLLMVIPHYFVLDLLGIAALVVAFIGWLVGAVHRATAGIRGGLRGRLLPVVHARPGLPAAADGRVPAVYA